MFSSLYHFDGHARLDLGFGNPNLAGGLLVMLAIAAGVLAWLWPRRPRLGAALATAVTLPLYLAVGLTYSRGAYVALGSALAALAALRTVRAWRGGRLRTPHPWRNWLPLPSAAFSCAGSTGISSAGWIPEKPEGLKLKKNRKVRKNDQNICL